MTIRHQDSKAFLHSHPERYPREYYDGRVSSEGQQVTGSEHPESNNEWQILPAKPLRDAGRGRVVRHDDVIQLLHVNTQTLLLTHDVVSPLLSTNQEFTTHPVHDHSRYNDTLFYLRLVDTSEHNVWKSKSGHFSLVHVPTRVSMLTHANFQLPPWAFKHQEVNGHREPSENTAVWFVDDIIASESK